MSSSQAKQEIRIVKVTANDLFSSLTAAERKMVYFLFRANLPFNDIYRLQNHPLSLRLIDLFKKILKEIKDPQVLEEAKIYLTQLYANHGPYFQREGGKNKRTPETLGLHHLHGYLKQMVDPELDPKVLTFLLDPEYESTASVPGSIEQSGNHFYERGVTTEIYQNTFTSQDKARLNVFFQKDGNVKTYSEIHFSKLQVTVSWLLRAFSLALDHQEHFDQHFITSLKYMMQFLQLGDEELFRQHQREWLQTNSRIDYTMGWIETYHDPMEIRGHAGAEVTVKVADINRLQPLLSELERRLPIAEDERANVGKSTAKIRNTSLNQILHSAGDYGPLCFTAAYCLPNYNDIRAELGSKQIIYRDDSQNCILLEKLKQTYSKHRLEFIQNYDPENKITNDLWDLQIILHETVGHGSGRLTQHLLVEGDPLTLSGVQYQMGQWVPLTDGIWSEFIKEDGSSLEELRAEIHALYMCVFQMDLLIQEDLFKQWPRVLEKTHLQAICIEKICNHYFRRLVGQPFPLQEIRGAHARANTVIANVLLADTGIGLTLEEGKRSEFRVLDLSKAKESIEKLAREVQRIKSQADGPSCRKLFETFTKFPITLDQAREFQQRELEIERRLQGDIKASARLFPEYKPIYNESGNLMDVEICTNSDFIEQNIRYDEMAEICG